MKHIKIADTTLSGVRNSLSFKQKLEILEGGFRSLCKEREDFETEKENFRGRFAAAGSARSDSINVSAYRNGVFFNGVDNVLALKKRYRDLLKIFQNDFPYW